MIYKPMDDTDIEEKLLLNALNNPHQALNLPMTYDNYARNNYYNNHYDNNKHHRRKSSYPKYYGETNKYSADRRDQQYDPFWKQNNSTRTSETVSMSTEESLFDDFDLDFEKPEQENNHHGNNNARSESTIHRDLPRSISMEEDNVVTAPTKVTPPRRKSNTPKNGGNTPYRVEVPTNSDILCGQSRVCASHPGNRTFQNVLDRFAHQYDNATSKQEKMCMTKEVVRIIQIDNGGHFLKFKDGMWEEISIVAARDKVSHALRTKVASWKRQKAQLLKQSENGSSTNGNGKRRLSTSSTKSQRRRLSDTSENHANDDDQTFEPISLERAESETIVNGLMATQQQIFANLTALPRSNRSSSIHHPPVQPTPMYDNSFLNNTMHPSRSTPQF